MAGDEMTPHWSLHLKHILIAAGLLLVLYIALNRWRDVRAKEIDAQTQVAVEVNKAKEQVVQGQVAQGQNTIVVADNDLRQKVAALEAQREAHLTSGQTQTQIEGLLPGVTVTSTTSGGQPVLQVPDTQPVRDAINGATADFKTCQFNLSDCKTVREQYEQVIVPGLKAEVALRQSTIDQQDKDLKALRARQVSPFMVGFGLGKSQGSTFNSIGSYQPDVLFGYRFDSRFGLFVNAQNKSVAAGVTWNVGGRR